MASGELLSFSVVNEYCKQKYPDVKATAMKAKVTEKGVMIPSSMLPGNVDEVEIRKEAKRVVIEPAEEADPLWGLGSNPVSCGVNDASENHDEYLYGGK